MLSADQCRSLRCLAEMMIPASAEYGVPSAGDDAIFGNILQSIGRDAGHVTAVLEALEAMSGGPFADLHLQRRDAIAAQLRETGGEDLVYLTRIILQCYYRDDGSCGRWAWNRGPRFPKASRWNKGTGPSWIRCARARSSIATPVDGNSLRAEPTAQSATASGHSVL